jgi:hypothetical protein
MRQTALRRMILPISLLQIGIIILTIVTALIHLQHGLSMGAFAGQGAGFSDGHPAGFSGGPPPNTSGGHPAGFSGRHPNGFPGRHSPNASGGPPAGFSGGPPAGSSIMAYLPVPLPTLFILNFIGYIVLVVALYMPPLQKVQRIIRWLLIGFTALTIIAWFLIAGSHPDTLGIVDKVIEVALIVLLLIEEWQAIRLRRG